jgi:hypothetical protein
MILSVLAGLELVLLWLVSSVLRGKGVLVMAAGVAALAATLVAALCGRRQLLYRLFFVTALVAACVLGVEAVLWSAPGLLHRRIANQVLSGYHSELDGIYVPDLYLGRTLRPGFTRSMYWNGHVWRHDANADGYRGPRVERAAAVFLGDSMIYGHGVETGETVPARFQAVAGLPSANLGQQGTGPVQALERLRRTGLRLRPRYVFFCAHPTDVMDAVAGYERAELQRFVQQDGYRPLARADQEPGVFQFWLAHVAIPLRAGRAVRGLMQGAPPDERPAAAGSEEAPFLPSRAAIAEAFAPLVEDADPDAALGWTVLRRAVGQIAAATREAGAEPVIFDIGYPAAFSAAVEGLAGEVEARYADAGRAALKAAQGGADVYLARDGHWSPTGCDLVARRLAAAVAEDRR